MSIFKKSQIKELDPKAQNFLSQLCSFVDRCNDEILLNKMFTEVTLLRMELDFKDSFLQNFKDWKKRREDISKKGLIKIQFCDVVENYKEYDIKQLQRIDSVMRIVVGSQEPRKWWEKLWDDIEAAIGVM